MTPEQQNQDALNLEVQTVQLDAEIKMGDQTITELEVRKPNTQALSGVKIADLLQGDVNAICKVLPRVTTPTLTPSQVQQLEVSDIAQIGGALMLFLQPKSQRAEILRQQ